MSETMQERSVLDILLSSTVRNVRKDRPVGYYKVQRLSKEAGSDVIFKLQALEYDASVVIGKSDTMDMDTVMAGVLEPNLRDVQLAQRLGVLESDKTWADSPATPQDLVKALLLPGEIAAISRAVQRLSAFQTVALQEVKKN